MAPKLPTEPGIPYTDIRLVSRYSRARSRTRLPLSRIIATVYSATGSALACAADDTAIPRSQQASVTKPLTDPAVCTIALRRGSLASTSAVIGGQPHPVTSRSTSGTSPRSWVTPVNSQIDRRSSSTGVRTAAAASADITPAALT